MESSGGEWSVPGESGVIRGREWSDPGGGVIWGRVECSRREWSGFQKRWQKRATVSLRVSK